MAARNEVDAPRKSSGRPSISSDRRGCDPRSSARRCRHRNGSRRTRPRSPPTSPSRGEDVGGGRLVLLYDPAGNDAWQGVFRCVAYARADIDPEMVTDPLLASRRLDLADRVADRPRRRVPRAERHGHPGRPASFGGMAGRPAQRRDRGPGLLDAAADAIGSATSRPGVSCCARRRGCRRCPPGWSRCPTGAANRPKSPETLTERPTPGDDRRRRRSRELPCSS